MESGTELIAWGHAELRAHVRSVLGTASRRLWREALSRADTLELLSPHVVTEAGHDESLLPGLPDVTGRRSALFGPRAVQLDPDFVWQMSAYSGVGRLDLSRAGGVIVNGSRVLNLDFGAAASLLDLPLKPRHVRVPLAVAPWSHFYRCYYDFVVWVLAKLCRIEEAFGPDLWRRATVCYPLFHTRYEREYLAMLGISPDGMLDTRSWTRAIGADAVIVANNQPIFTPSPRDLTRLRQRFCPSGWSGGHRRLFLPRRQKRRVRNEADVLAVLRKFDFEIVDEESRSVADQIRLFGDAAVIVAPHGSALTNVLWCAPGTRVLELFHGRYTPPYFHYLCAMLGLRYAYLLDRHTRDQSSREDGEKPRGDFPLSSSLLAHTGADMEIDPAALTSALDIVLS